MARKTKAEKHAAALKNGMSLLVRMSYAQHVALGELAEAAGVSRAKWITSRIDRAGKVAAEDRRPGVGRPAGEE